MKKLHELGDDYKKAFDDLSGQDLSPEIIGDSLSVLEDSFSKKALSIVTYSKDQDNFISNIDKEISRLKKIKDTAVKERNSYLEYLRYNMSESGISNIKSEISPFWSITLPKATQQLRVIDESLIPKKYFNVTVTKKLDKKLLLIDLKRLGEGENIDGAELVLNKPNIRIK